MGRSMLDTLRPSRCGSAPRGTPEAKTESIRRGRRPRMLDGDDDDDDHEEDGGGHGLVACHQ